MSREMVRVETARGCTVFAFRTDDGVYALKMLDVVGGKFMELSARLTQEEAGALAKVLMGRDK